MAARTKKIPLRKCIGCQQMRDKKEMIRILRTPEGEIVLDPTGRKNGRGAYLCRNPECLKKAVKNKGIERSLHVPVSSDTYDSLKKEIELFDK